MGIIFSNNASSTLASGITTGATSLTVATGEGSKFPAAGGSNWFYCTLIIAATNTREIVKVTSRSGDVFTITRAQEGTTATAFSSGDLVRHQLTAATLGEFVSATANTTFSGNNTFSGDNTFTGTQTFRDNKFEITDDSDNTKKLTVQLSGITTATTRTLTPQDKSYTIADHADIINTKQTVWIPATAFVGRTTNGATTGTVETTTNKVMVKTLDFDQTTAEYAQFSMRMPKGWNEGTLTATFLWSSNVSGTNSVVWGLQAVALSDDDALDAAFGTAQTVIDAQTAQGDLMQTAETSAITIGGTPAENDLVVLQVYRDASNGSDTLAGDARLHGISLFYTAAVLSDA